MLLRIQIANFVRAGCLAIPASDTAVRIYQDNTVLALVGRFDRADGDTNRIITLIAVDGEMFSGNIREPSLFH